MYEGCFTKKYNFLITSLYISLERQGLVTFFHISSFLNNALITPLNPVFKGVVAAIL